jgi:hypothetical protein
MMRCYVDVKSRINPSTVMAATILNPASHRIYNAFRDFLDTFHRLVI